MMKTCFVACFILSTCLANTAWAVGLSELTPTGSFTAASHEKGPRVKIRITIGTKTMTAELDNNPTARDFLSLLPLTVTLRDFSRAEKVSDALPRRLSEADAPASAAGEQDDIAYYAPWGNIAFYRGEGPDAQGVIKIGKIVSGSEALHQPGQISTTLSRAE
ncbi:cyclophilin-like fold protein [Dickeya dianthicola]